jgi:hypothetical protein
MERMKVEWEMKETKEKNGEGEILRKNRRSNRTEGKVAGNTESRKESKGKNREERR